MNNLKLMAAVALCMAYAAGIATGWAGNTLAGEHRPPPERGGSWLSHTLGLDDAQKEQLEAIWSNVGPGKDEDPRKRIRDLYDERNAEVRAMLSEAQQVEFDAIYQAFEDKKAALEAERRQRFDDAVAATRAILTPEQDEKYTKILEEFERKGPRRGRGPGHFGHKD